MIPRFSIRRLKERLRTNTISQYIPPDELQFLPPLRIEDNRILFNGYVDRQIRGASLTPNPDESYGIDRRAMRSFFKSRGGERFMFLYDEYPAAARIIEGTFEVDYRSENGFTYLARTLQHSRPGKLLLIPVVGGDELAVVLA